MTRSTSESLTVIGVPKTLPLEISCLWTVRTENFEIYFEIGEDLEEDPTNVFSTSSQKLRQGG
jgi:hypothetical protein